MTGLGRHAATDGSFGKSAGSALFRGAGLVCLAVILGLIMLYWGTRDSGDGALDVSSPGDTGEVVDDGADEGATGSEESGTDGSDGTDGTDGVTNSVPSTDTVAPPTTEDAGSGNAKPPSEVLVIAANAVGTPGLAGGLKDDLTVMNYKVDVANAPNSSVSKVYFKQGYRANAREIVDNLGKDPSLIQRLPNDGSVTVKNDDDGARLAAAHVIIIIGSDDIF